MNKLSPDDVSLNCTLLLSPITNISQSGEYDLPCYTLYMHTAAPMVERLFGREADKWVIELDQIQSDSNIVLLDGANDGELIFMYNTLYMCG